MFGWDFYGDGLWKASNQIHHHAILNHTTRLSKLTKDIVYYMSIRIKCELTRFHASGHPCINTS